MGSKIPLFIDTEEAPRLNLAKGIETLVLSGLNGEAMMMVQHRIAPGATAPLHAHSNQQCGLIHSGSGRLTIGNMTREVKTGDCFYMTSDIKHGVINTGDDTLVMIEVFHPVREDFVNMIKNP
ncbi:MAG: cupin domain-containing protein [candidate division Zixibacteria bacterium]|jgi:quercetin dioxygenase-like cupin family protein|nr:cupin domain-containing protein [candidate division Zixibacteria bacterium]